MSPITQPNLKARKILFALLLALICVTLVYSVWQQTRSAMGSREKETAPRPGRILHFLPISQTGDA